MAQCNYSTVTTLLEFIVIIQLSLQYTNTLKASLVAWENLIFSLLCPVLSRESVFCILVELLYTNIVYPRWNSSLVISGSHPSIQNNLVYASRKFVSSPESPAFQVPLLLLVCCIGYKAGLSFASVIVWETIVWRLYSWISKLKSTLSSEPGL